VWVSSAISNDYHGKLNFEWEVYEQGTWKLVSIVKKTTYDDMFVELEIPDKKSQYRIYVHATDSVGNVVTASRPLLVE
jgi:hypothetical protein